MNLTELILITLKISIVLSVFALGLKATLQDATHLFRKPGKLARAVLSIDILMPLFVLWLVAVFDLHPAVKIALVALSVSPIPPILPKKAMKAGGRKGYTIGLLVAAGTIAVIFTPAALELFERASRTPLQMPATSVATLVLTTILVPLAAGIAIRAAAPAFGARVAEPLAAVATLLLIVSAMPILFSSRQAIMSLIGDGTLAAMVAFSVVGLVAGHLLGGPESGNRTVLALSTSARHPGMAIAIANTNFPGQKLALAAVFLFLVVNAIVSAAYLAWTKHRMISGSTHKEHRAA